MKIFYGAKGSGKTKAVIDFANDALTTAKGHVVFITDTDRYGFDLKLPIRFVNSADFGVSGEKEMLGFIKGIVASNGDNEYVVIDGLARICDIDLKDTYNVFAAMEKLEKDYGVKFVVTCSGLKEDLPDFVVKYID